MTNGETVRDQPEPKVADCSASSHLWHCNVQESDGRATATLKPTDETCMLDSTSGITIEDFHAKAKKTGGRFCSVTVSKYKNSGDFIPINLLAVGGNRVVICSSEADGYVSEQKIGKNWFLPTIGNWYMPTNGHATWTLKYEWMYAKEHAGVYVESMTGDKFQCMKAGPDFYQWVNV